MKTYLCIVGILSALVLAQADTHPELKKLFEECGKEHGVSGESFKETPNFDDPKLKCFSACIMKKKDALVEGKVVAEKLLELAQKYHPDVVPDTLKADLSECAGKANEEKEECAIGGAFFKCFVAKHGRSP